MLNQSDLEIAIESLKRIGKNIHGNSETDTVTLTLFYELLDTISEFVYENDLTDLCQHCIENDNIVNTISNTKFIMDDGFFTEEEKTNLIENIKQTIKDKHKAEVINQEIQLKYREVMKLENKLETYLKEIADLNAKLKE